MDFLLDNARRLITLNSRLHTSNESLARQFEALARARSHTIQTAKLAAVGKIAASISEEVSAPLSIIQQEAEVILDACDQHPTDDGSLMSALQIQQETQRIKNVVCQIRDFARRSSDRYTPIALAEVITEATAILELRLASALLRIDIPEDLPPFRGDRTQIIQAIVNLLDNALEAQANNSSISIKIQGYLPEDNADYVRLTIADEGHGMDLDTRTQVLEPFFTTKKIKDGAGLGLTVTHSIVDLHEGRLKNRIGKRERHHSPHGPALVFYTQRVWLA